MLTLRLALEHEIAYAVSVCTVMACEGASVTLLAVMVTRQFGARRGAQLYSFAVSSVPLAMIFTNVLQYSVGLYQGYLGVFLIAFAFALGALMINLSMDERPLIYRDLYRFERHNELTRIR
jgi:hypothetical protein